MTRFFVTGTDTGVGKTEVSCALLSLLPRPFAFKPCESGGTGDTEALREAAGGWQPLESICVYRLKAPLAPLHAATKEKTRVEFAKLLRAFSALRGDGVVEGAGGLFVPLTQKHDVIDLAEKLALPVVLVARAGLGTVNHTTLSLRALNERRLRVAAVVLMQGTPGSDEAIAVNRAELQRRFPRTRFIGPVKYEPDAKQRRASLRRALRPLLQGAQPTVAK